MSVISELRFFFFIRINPLKKFLNALSSDHPLIRLMSSAINIVLETLEELPVVCRNLGASEMESVFRDTEWRVAIYLATLHTHWRWLHRGHLPYGPATSACQGRCL